jgi:hypothetical protein
MVVEVARIVLGVNNLRDLPVTVGMSSHPRLETIRWRRRGNTLPHAPRSRRGDHAFRHEKTSAALDCAGTQSRHLNQGRQQGRQGEKLGTPD